MKSNLVGGSLSLATGLAAVIGSLALPVGTPAHPQAGFFPLVAGACLVIVSIVLLVREVRWPESPDGRAFAIGGPASVLTAMLVGSLLLDHAGFVPVALMIATTVTRAVGVRSWPVAVVFGAVLSVALYLLFRRALGVDLPPGLLAFMG